MRRLIRSAVPRKHPGHFAFMSITTPVNEVSKKLDELFDLDSRLLGVRVIRYDPDLGGKGKHLRVVTLVENLDATFF
mgnify:CR=1 FL=1